MGYLSLLTRPVVIQKPIAKETRDRLNRLEHDLKAKQMVKAEIQQVSARHVTTSAGRTVIVDWLIMLPPDCIVEPNDLIVEGNVSYEAQSIDRIQVRGVAHHVEALAKVVT